ncbi:MAG TPA: hypothetical protein VEQ65_00500, partial [Opitutus sp.]|nr:hypothetical protein [Opitutus sp.]
MPALIRGLLPLLGVVVTLAFARAAELSADAVAAAQGAVVNVRDFGAIGDGRLHPLSEWVSSGRFRSLRALRAAHPWIDGEAWTIDELAFALAKRALPPEGGTIYFPAGHYVTGQHAWKIWQNNVRLLGDGAERTTLSTAPSVADALSVAPYRHVGWLEGPSREYAFTAESGARGSDSVRLKLPDAARDFQPGEIVFIRNGANRFDQDYGEFNEVAAIDASGALRFRWPLARDYTLARLNWANELAVDFKMPARGKVGKATLRTGEGFFPPHAKATIAVGEQTLRVDQVNGNVVHLSNGGRANAPRGTVIPAGTKIAKSRSVIKLTRSTRNFRCEKLTIVGRRKVVNISNSYDVAFADCVFVRDLRDGGFKGGLTIDGDGGRFARFERCRVIAQPAISMQFARSFGSVVFADCSFTDTNVVFTEFNFDCEVTRCTFDVTGTRALTSAIVAGKSCGDLRFIDNRIRATGVPTIVDTVSDIHSQKHGGEGEVL